MNVSLVIRRLSVAPINAQRRHTVHSSQLKETMRKNDIYLFLNTLDIRRASHAKQKGVIHQLGKSIIENRRNSDISARRVSLTRAWYLFRGAKTTVARWVLLLLWLMYWARLSASNSWSTVTFVRMQDFSMILKTFELENTVARWVLSCW